MSGSEQAGMSASAKLPAVPGSAAPLLPSHVASGGLRRAPSRKRGRAAAQGQQADTITLTATETAPAPTSTSSQAPAERVPSLSKGTTHQTGEASMPLSEGLAADPEQAAGGNRRNPRRTLESKAAVAQADALPEQVAANADVPSTTSLQSASAGDNETDGLKQAKRNSRRTGSASLPVKQEHQATGDAQPSTAALEQLGSASHVKSEPSDTPASASNGAPQAAHPTDKPKTKRKAQQSKAAVTANAAPHKGDTPDAQLATAPAAKMSRQKRAKVEKVVADASAAVAEEAAAQNPAVAEAPVAGLDEHKPRKRSRPAKKAQPPPTDAADGDISASEASASEGDAGMSGAASAGESGAAAKDGKASKPRKRAAPRAKKAAAPDAGNDEIKGSVAAMAASDASMSDASVSKEAAADPANAAAAGKTAKPRKRAPRTKKAAAPDSAAASSMSEASEGQQLMFSSRRVASHRINSSTGHIVAHAVETLLLWLLSQESMHVLGCCMCLVHTELYLQSADVMAC